MHWRGARTATGVVDDSWAGRTQVRPFFFNLRRGKFPFVHFLSRQHMRRLLLAFLLVSIGAHAQVLSLRTSTSMYGWQRFDSVGTSSNHYRGYESLTLDLGQGQWHLRTSGSFSNDFGVTQSSDMLVRLYNLYAEGNGIADHVDIKAGRVPVFMGAGATTIDGGLVKLHYDDYRYTLTAAAGGQLENTSKVSLFSNLSENLFIGAQGVAHIGEASRIGLSYVRKDRTPLPDTIMIADTGSILHPFLFHPAAEREERASLDAATELLDNKLELYGRGDYDFAATSLARLELSGRYDLDHGLSARVEYLHREALVAYNSFFAVFDHGTFGEISGTVTYTPEPRGSISVSASSVSYTDASALRATVAGRWDGLSLAVTSQSGDAGTQMAATLEENYPLSTMFTVSGALGFSSYKFANDTTGSHSSLALVLGGSVRPSARFSADVQVQYLQNVLYQSDMRVFLRANWWLFERL